MKNYLKLKMRIAVLCCAFGSIATGLTYAEETDVTQGPALFSNNEENVTMISKDVGFVTDDQGQAYVVFGKSDNDRVMVIDLNKVTGFGFVTDDQGQAYQGQAYVVSGKCNGQCGGLNVYPRYEVDLWNFILKTVALHYIYSNINID